MTTTVSGTGSGPPHSTNRRNKQRLFVGLVVVVLAGLASTVLYTTLSQSEAEAFAIEPIEAEEPVFEPKDSPGADAFYSLDEQIEDYEEEFDVEVLPDDIATGLFGGTEENTCDPERLVAFLIANPDLGEAWAQVIGIGFDEIPDYVQTLETRTLAEDHEVLNHGYDNKARAAYEINSTLAAGTAVLVDKDGEIKTRCYCGNPIRPKPPTGNKPKDNNGKTGGGGKVVVVVANPRANLSRCILFASPVYAQPNQTGSAMTGVPSRVDLTGRAANHGGHHWSEITWGSGSNQTGWVQTAFLAKRYCRPPQLTWCAGPGVVPVFDNPSPSNQTQVGELNVAVPVSSTNSTPMALVNPVGGSNHVVVNGFVLVRYQQAAPSTALTGWVALSDLDQDIADCAPVIECIDTPGPVLDRIGGTPVAPAGMHRVRFSGHHGPAPATHAEVQLLDAGATMGWVDYNYTVMSPSDCDPEPPVLCVERSTAVWNSSTTTDPADLVGHVNRAQVTMVGGPTAGRIQIELSPFGPSGWIDTPLFGQDCEPKVFCADITNVHDLVLEDLNDPTSVLAGTPGTKVSPVQVHGKTVYQPSAYRYITMPSGDSGWVHWADLRVRTDCDEPPVEFDCSSTIEQGRVVTVNAAPVGHTYWWDFGDGNGTATGPNATYTYPLGAGDGPFTIVLSATDTNTNQIVTIECGVVEFEQVPWEIACENLGSTAPVLAPGSTVGQFSITANPPSTLTNLNVTWDFGEGPPQTGNPSSTHTYNNPGTFAITVVADDGDGNTVSVPCHTVIIEEPPEIEVWCSVEPTPAAYGQPLTATVDWSPSSLPLDVDLVWADNNGALQTASTGSTLGPVTDTYTGFAPPTSIDIGWDDVTDPNVQGQIQCPVQVCEEGQEVIDGACQRDWQLICENWGPTDSTVPVGTQVGPFHIDSQGNASFSGFTWDFGDGNQEQNTDPSSTHTYGAPGTYSVTLTATHTNGSTKSVTCHTVTVVAEDPPPLEVACFVEPSLVEWGQPVTATATWTPATAMDVDFEWFGSGSFLTNDTFLGTGPGTWSTYSSTAVAPDYVAITVTDPGSGAQAITECLVNMCPPGQLAIGGECVTDEIGCPAGTTLVEGQCVAECPGDQLSNGECCPPGTIAVLLDYGEDCFNPNDVVCPPGSTLVDGTCVEDCPPEQLLNNGECCPPGAVSVGDGCVMRSASTTSSADPTAAAIAAAYDPSPEQLHRS